MAINAWAVALLRYEVGVLKRTKELKELDRKSRKTIVMYRAPHPAQTLSFLRPVSRLGTVHVYGAGELVHGICWEAPVVNNDWQI